MTSVKWMCFVLIGLAALQATATAQNISPRFIYKDVALQGRGSALSTGYRPGENVSPNDYTGAGPSGFRGAPESDQSSILGNLASRGWNFIKGGIKTALGIGQAGLNFFRKQDPAASQPAAPSGVSRFEPGQRTSGDYLSIWEPYIQM